MVRQLVLCFVLLCVICIGTVAHPIPVSAPVQAAQPTESASIWFDDLAGPLSGSLDEQGLLVSYAAALLTSAAPAPAMPDVYTSDTRPRMVALSASDGTARAIVAWGSGTGILPAIDNAVAALAADLPPTFALRWLALDVVQEATLQADVQLALPIAGDAGLHGVAFSRDSSLALLPAELLATGLIVENEAGFFLDTAATSAYLATRPDQAATFATLRDAPVLDLYLFTTTSFFWADGQVTPLYRGHARFAEPTSDTLLTAAVAGGRYLTAAVQPDGTFVYLYDPTTDQVAESYNILRHAGTIYAMLELYAVAPDAELLAAAQQAIGYLVRTIRPCITLYGPLPCVVEDGYTKLGGNGLAIVALAQYTTVTGDESYIPLMRDLARWIQSVQAYDGEFLIHKQAYPTGEIDDFVSQYYPGEALLGLSRLYALDPRSRWRNTATAGARWLITVRDGEVSDAELAHDHWLLYALNDLYRIQPDPLYLEHALRIARVIRESQNREPAYADWLGSYYIPPRSTPTATRTEGLCAAYQLARDAGFPDDAREILLAMQLGTGFQLATYLDPPSVLYFPNPRRALGGFRRSLTEYDVRIDYVQHNISSLLCLRAIQEGP